MIDTAGNIIGRRAGSDSKLKPLLFGSHIDSVPEGGNYDGDVGSLRVGRFADFCVVDPRRPDTERQRIMINHEDHAALNLQVARLAPTLLRLKSDRVYHFGKVPSGSAGPDDDGVRRDRRGRARGGRGG